MRVYRSNLVVPASLIGCLIAEAAAGEGGPPTVPVTATQIASARKAHCDVPRPSPDGRWLSYVVENDTGNDRSVMLYDTATGATPEAIQPEMEHGDIFVGPDVADELEDIEQSQLGGKEALVTRVCHEFRWQAKSALGAYVIACDNERQHYDLFFSDQAGAAPRPISRHPGNALHPAVQPVPGMAVVFASSRRSKGDLFVIDTPTQVTKGDAARPLVGGPDAAESSPVWSPDGKQIVYLRLGETSETGEDLYVTTVDEAGAKPRRLTRMLGAESEPRWSRDGRMIAFYNARRAGEPADLFVVDAAGGAPRLIARDVIKSDGAGPAWTPDGAGLIFAAHRDSINPLHIYWLETGVERRIDTGTLLNRAPAVAQDPKGGWWLVWSAQAAVGDAQKRWYGIYRADLPRGADDLR